jgi:hypothetical protein
VCLRKGRSDAVGYGFVNASSLRAGGWRPSASHDAKETASVPEIMLLPAVANPEPEAVQPVDPAAPSARAE